MYVTSSNVSVLGGPSRWWGCLSLPTAPAGPTVAVAASPVAEPGVDKTLTQHAGNFGFTVVSLAACTESRALQMVPGLNLAVAAVEGYNAIARHRKGDDIVAMGHAGNATGCFASFIEDVARYASAFGIRRLHPGIGAAIVGFGIVGGAFGVVQGLYEISIGRVLHERNRSKRTLIMGAADLASGGLTLAGIVLRSGGFAPISGAAMLVGASACDLLSVGADYLKRPHGGGSSWTSS